MRANEGIKNVINFISEAMIERRGAKKFGFRAVIKREKKKYWQEMPGRCD